MKREMVAIGVVLLFVCLTFAPSMNAVDNNLNIRKINNGNLSGYVFDIDLNPIEDALVRVHFHGIYEEDYSDENGFYHVTNIPICYCLKNCTCSKEGYSTDWVLMGITENTTYDFTLILIEPFPDLDCSGDLAFVDVEPGATLTGTITVENVGDVDSLLNWEILSYPDWGTWTFDPEDGVNLLAGDTVTIDVEIVAPLDPNVEFTGEVVIVNSDDPSDFCDVEISQPIKNKDMIFVDFEGYTPIQLVFLLINKLRYNNDIQNVVSEDDVLQIIESDTELVGIIKELESYDCGCEDKNPELVRRRWWIVCIIIFPFYISSILFTFITDIKLLEMIMYTISEIFNCDFP